MLSDLDGYWLQLKAKKRNEKLIEVRLVRGGGCFPLLTDKS